MTDELGHDNMERRLRGYFASQREALQAPADLWDNVSAKLGPQDPLPWWRRLVGGTPLQGVGTLYAGAAAALAVAVVGAVMYAAIIGIGDAGDTQESLAAGVPSSPAAPAAAAPEAMMSTAAAAAPEAAATKAPASMSSAPLADSSARGGAGQSRNAAVTMPQEEPPPFRYEVRGMRDGVSMHLFWVALPDRWSIGNALQEDGAWTGTFTSPDVTLVFMFGGPVDAAGLFARGRSQTPSQELRMWDESVIGNTGYVLAPLEGQRGDLLLVLQLPTGALQFTGKALTPGQQETALTIFRSIIS